MARKSKNSEIAKPARSHENSVAVAVIAAGLATTAFGLGMAHETIDRAFDGDVPAAAAATIETLTLHDNPDTNVRQEMSADLASAFAVMGLAGLAEVIAGGYIASSGRQKVNDNLSSNTPSAKQTVSISIGQDSK